MIKSNMRELWDFTGSTIETESQLETVTRKLLETSYCEVIVISPGGSGGFLISKGLSKNPKSLTILIKSKVGAGESTELCRKEDAAQLFERIITSYQLLL